MDSIDTFKWIWRLRAWLAICFPLIGSFGAMSWAGAYGVHVSTIVATIAIYAATMFGVTGGYHRYMTHRSFECGRAVKCALAVLGCMAAQGPPLFWVAISNSRLPKTGVI